MSIACAVLAAGLSEGRAIPKELTPIHASPTLVRWTAQCACGSRCTRVSLVVGARALAVADSISGLPVEIIDGFDWREGSAAGIRAATLWAIDRSAAALLLCGADQPFLTTRHLNALLFASEHGMRLVASYYGGKAAVPAVIPERYFGELLALSGGEDAAALLTREKGAVCIAWPEGAIEVDAPSEISQIH